jgi:hypothetical protein
VEPIIPAKASKVLWIIYTAASIAILPTLLVAFPESPKWLGVAAIAVSNVGALLRYLTTNSFAAPVPVTQLPPKEVQ